MIERIHRQFRAYVLDYEVQVWDRQLLENLRYTILRGNEAERGETPPPTDTSTLRQ